MKNQPSVPIMCKNHPSLPAKFQCQRCGGCFCHSCVHVKEVADVKIITCPECKDVCRPLSQATTHKKGASNLSFFYQLLDSFVYPIRGHGWVMLLVYIGLLLFLTFAAYLPIIGFVSGIARLILSAYIAAFLLSVITSSAGGDRQLPDWPEVSNWWEDILRPSLMFTGTGIFCFLPLIIYSIYWLYVAFGSANVEVPSTYPYWILGGIGAFYFPMALLSVAIHDNLLGMNPIKVIPSIFRIFPYYLAILFMIGIVTVIIELTKYIPGAVYVFGLYFQLVIMRLLGLIYQTNHKKLAWFASY